MVGIKYKLQNDDPKKCPCCGGKAILLVLPSCSELPVNVCQKGMVALVSNGGMECVRELDSDFNPTEPLPE